MAKKKQKVGECVYCGLLGPLTRDHVPPEALFPPNTPDLWTVPSCRQCNAGFSKDDEYFRLALAVTEDTAELAEAQGVLPAALRGLARDRSAGFRKTFLKSMRRFEIKTPAGVYVGTKPGFNVDLTRLNGVAARIVRGLYFRERGTRLTDDFQAAAYWTGAMEGQLEDTDVIGLMETLMANSKPRTKGDTFTYWVMAAQDSPTTLIWLLLFFRQISFICFTAKISDIDAIARANREATETGSG